MQSIFNILVIKNLHINLKTNRRKGVFVNLEVPRLEFGWRHIHKDWFHISTIVLGSLAFQCYIEVTLCYVYFYFLYFVIIYQPFTCITYYLQFTLLRHCQMFFLIAFHETQYKASILQKHVSAVERSIIRRNEGTNLEKFWNVENYRACNECDYVFPENKDLNSVLATSQGSKVCQPLDSIYDTLVLRHNAFMWAVHFYQVIYEDKQLTIDFHQLY